MDERTKELIAIGASVSAHCQPCLTWHVGKAREIGIDDETIREAIETGHMVEKGAMSAMRKFSADVLETKTECTVHKVCEALKSFGVHDEHSA
ncbi:carboxymuconolactone decarboxylase family protein [Geobacter sp. SVR]|uniref:carboxymuconolactone decarboxylase family protein n=1 Tax=Geobacter sp. SVR TaxID=2495594 RepID=UPI00143EFAAC|nr:carboxymuconolactone decarboxylase family protein [Geobacter sp. SVR]BCS51877.1 hypothetical protein GSVR_01850 [Geobacter sp. SVR]GCF87739.1 hypothetical protein GSbR_43390 [Geobacter sp. SVR]